MPKKATTLPLALPFRDRNTPAIRWLYAAVRSQILAGQLRPGARLPATRDLARQYGLSRGTILNAFEQLKSEGYLRGRTGSGTYVSKVLPEELLQVEKKAGDRAIEPPRSKQRLSGFAKRLQPLPPYEPSLPRAFRANRPALDLFPLQLWSQIAGRRLRRDGTSLLTGCHAFGYLPLRRAIADYLRSSRGANCTVDQIVIVSGVQEALDLVSRLFLEPGDRVCMEDPGYIGAAQVFTALGAKVVPVRVDDQGMLTPRVSGARLAYVTPAHQFPLGTTMSIARRQELLDWSRRTGAMLFEDDYDSEYRYRGRPIPVLQGLDRAGMVFLCGSFSKVLFPSLRLGYLLIPTDFIDYFAGAKSLTNRHAPLLEQAVLCEFMSEGHFGRHLRRMREVYAERLHVLVSCARKTLHGLLEVSDIEAGLQTVGWLRCGIDAQTAARAAAERNVEVTSLTEYSRGCRKEPGLQLGFAAVDTGEIRRGVRELALALEMAAAAPIRDAQAMPGNKRSIRN
jgi:GntR family transcriptional regulator/MocR family aminotransferase